VTSLGAVFVQQSFAKTQQATAHDETLLRYVFVIWATRQLYGLSLLTCSDSELILELFTLPTPPSSAEFNMWSYTSTPSMTSHFTM